jgi:two-component system sensor histidine kinase/response regulator
MTEPRPLRILLVDDDESTFVITRELLREINGRPVELEWTGEADEGYDLILRDEHEVYLIDYRLGADDGLDVLRRARAAGCKAPILILTGQTDDEIDQRALEAGASDYLAKDVYDVSRLEHAIRYALERHGLLLDLEKERYLLHSLMERLPDNIYFKDRDSRFVRISLAMANWFGLKDPRDAVGRSDDDFFTQEHAQQARQDERRLMESGDPVIGKEEKETWPDGRTTWVSTSKMPLRDRDGNIVGTFGISRDITDEKLAMQALKRSELLNRLIVVTALDAFIATDSEGTIVNWNPQAEKTFGWKYEEAIGQSVVDLLVPGRFRDEFSKRLAAFLETGEGEFLDEHLELTALHRNGEEFPVEATISPIEQEGNWLFSAFVHDISRRKQAERELRGSKENAEQANRAKSDFLANMSHEIRTPMNAILGMTELVLDTELATTQREYLSMVRESGDVLLNLINDILDFSKIEAGQFELDPRVFSLRESLGDTLKSLAVRADRVELELACHIDPAVPDSVVGDPGRLRQIVVNLVGNAIKFTEHGEVVLHVEVDQQDEKSALLHFAVADTGIGIAREKLKTIFEAFHQADTSTTRRYGGTGLGLTICSRLIALMGGSVWAESQPGQGSTFHFTGRFGLSDEVPAGPRRRMVQGTRVLVVDDNETNRLILDEMLQNWGMTVTCVDGADAAAAQLRSAKEAGSPYTLVLSDVNMPDRDGFDLAGEIQSDETLADAVILMLTSGDRSDEVQQARELGVAAYLRKPVKQSELFDAIVASLGVDATEPEVDGSPVAAAFDPKSIQLPPMRVLLVEDSIVNQRLALGLLNRWGHSVTVAGNGVEAVLQVSQSEFDFILMDIQMPEMDGLEATRLIRVREDQYRSEGKTDRHVPIIALTAHAMKGDREACLEAGMDAYVSKPVRSWQLLEEIAAFFPDCATGSATGKDSAVDPSAKGDPTSQSGDEPRWQIDWPAAFKVVNGDRELLGEISQAFLDESAEIMPALRKAVADGDEVTAGRLAHTMKASFRTIGVDGAHDVALACEQAAKEGRLEVVIDRLPELAEATEVVCRQLSGFIDTGRVPS